MRYSFIIPVYNRLEEVDELLNSLTRQTNKNFEVLIVEDGSFVPATWGIEGFVFMNSCGADLCQVGKPYFMLWLLSVTTYGQNNVIDEVVWVVGDEAILKSDV